MSKSKGTTAVGTKSHVGSNNDKVVSNPTQHARATNASSSIKKTENKMPIISKSFLMQQKDQLKTAKAHLKNFREYILDLEKNIMQKDDIIKALHNKLQVTTPAFSESTVNTEALIEERNQYRNMYQEVKERYTNLEKSYDSKYFQLNQKFERLTADHNKEHSTLKAQIKTLTEELSIQKQQHDQQQDQLNECKTELLTTKATLDAQNIKSQKENKENEMLIKEYELKLAELQNELQLKDDIVQKCQHEKEELENAKNKIIDEQAYKLLQVNRVMDQRTLVVPPVSSHVVQPHKRPVKPIEYEIIENDEHIEEVHASSSNANVVKRQNITRNTRSEHNNERKRQKVNYFENDSSDDDDGEPIDSGWIPQFPSKNTESSRPIQRASGTSKRKAMDDVVIQESSDSENAFDRLLGKRNKKNAV